MGANEEPEREVHVLVPVMGVGELWSVKLAHSGSQDFVTECLLQLLHRHGIVNNRVPWLGRFVVGAGVWMHVSATQ